MRFAGQDPAGGGTFSGVGAQVMGPEDGYLIQHSPSVRTFWASSTALELGDTFQRGTQLPAYSYRCVVSSQGLRILYRTTYSSVPLQGSLQGFAHHTAGDTVFAGSAGTANHSTGRCTAAVPLATGTRRADECRYGHRQRRAVAAHLTGWCSRRTFGGTR